jgi:putative DNA primase/helicase
VRDVEAIARALGGQRNGKGWKIRCPVHDDHEPSASIRDDGLVTCWVCGPSRRKELWAALDRLGFVDDDLVVIQNPEAARAHMAAEQAKARAQWTLYPDEPPTEYLARRGISIPAPPCLRGFRSIACFAAVTAPDGRLVAVQTKYAGSRPKTVGVLEDGAVRLAEPRDGVLGLAEGVEDGMSAMQLFEVPCWAALGAGRMASVLIPPSVTELYLFGDNDDEGRRTVARAAKKHCHLRVRTRFPVEGKDWNEFLNKDRP